MKDLIVYAKPDDVLGAEVVAVNRDRGLIWLELDSGEPALLPASLLKGEDRWQRESRLTCLKSRTTQEEGTSLTVTVVSATGMPGSRRNIKVTERPLAEATKSRDGDSAPHLTEEAVTACAKLYPMNRVLRAVVESNGGSGGILVNLGQHVATLPDSELKGTKRESLRRNVAVRVMVKSITGDGIVVTRQGVA